MVLLVQKLGLPFTHSSSKTESRRSRPPMENDLRRLRAFQSEAMKIFSWLSEKNKPGVGFVSLRSIRQSLELVASLNNAFTKLAKEIDYPESKWGADSVEECLGYTLTLLGLLNSVSSSLSSLRQARVRLSHASALVESSPSRALNLMKKIQLKGPRSASDARGEKDKPRQGKDLVLHEALLDMKGLGSWACRLALSGLGSENRPKSPDLGSVGSSPMVFEMGFGGETAKEVTEVNEAVGRILLDLANGRGGGFGVKEELGGKLEVLEMGLKEVEREVDQLFSRVLAWRSELLEIVRGRYRL